MLAAAAREIGAVQIQNRGTLGGNIANGSPAGDTLPVLAAADALVELRSLDGTRTVPFTEFYTGYRASVRRPDELITAVEMPRVDGAQWFRKVGTRAAQSISKVVMAGVRADGAAHRRSAAWRRPSSAPRRTEDALAAGASLAEAQQHPAAGDQPDRRHPLDRRLPPRGRRAPARAVLGGHAVVARASAYFPSAASFSRAFVTSRWNTKSLSALSDLSVKFQVFPPFCFTLSSFFKYSISNTSRALNGNANASFLLAVSYRIPSGVATSLPSHDLPMRACARPPPRR